MECQALRNGEGSPLASVFLGDKKSFDGWEWAPFSQKAFLQPCTPGEGPREWSGIEPGSGLSQNAVWKPS